MKKYNYTWQIRLSTISNLNLAYFGPNISPVKDSGDYPDYNHICKNPDELLDFVADMVYFNQEIADDSGPFPITLAHLRMDFMSQTSATKLYIWQGAIKFDVEQINKLIWEKDPVKVKECIYKQFDDGLESKSLLLISQYAKTRSTLLRLR